MVDSPQSGFWPGVYAPLRAAGRQIADVFSPSTDAAATEATYEIAVELPGVAAEDIDVSVHDGTLVVKGEKRSSREEAGRSYFFTERGYGTFLRSFRCPATATGSVSSLTTGTAC